MDKRLAHAAQQFLQRVTLQPAEIQAFQAVDHALNVILNTPDAPPPQLTEETPADDTLTAEQMIAMSEPSEPEYVPDKVPTAEAIPAVNQRSANA